MKVVNSPIFVVNPISLLIFEKIFDQKEEDYENHKGYQDPLNPFIVFSVPQSVFFIGEYHNQYKCHKKKHGKN
nr:hypothetical protein [Allomuricauda sp.]